MPADAAGFSCWVRLGPNRYPQLLILLFISILHYSINSTINTSNYYCCVILTTCMCEKSRSRCNCTADDGHAFTSPTVRCPMAQVALASRHRLTNNAANTRQRSRPRVMMENSFRPSEVMSYVVKRGCYSAFVLLSDDVMIQMLK